MNCQTDPDETLTPATYHTAMECEDSGNSCDEPDAATVTTAKEKTVHLASRQGPPDRYLPYRSTSSGQSKSVRIKTRPTRLCLVTVRLTVTTTEKRDHKAPTPATRQLTQTQKKIPSKKSTDSVSDDGYVRTTKPRHTLKPPKYDGSTPFETFWAQFKNFAGYNKCRSRSLTIYNNEFKLRLLHFTR